MIVLFLHRMLESARRRRERRKTIKALSALSDYHLEDVGVSRDDIVRLASASRPNADPMPTVRPQARRTGVAPRDRAGETQPCAAEAAGSPAPPRQLASRAPARY